MENKQVHWFFKRFQVNAPVLLHTFELPGGMGFLLRRFHLIQPDHITIPGAPPVIVPFPSVAVELTDGTGATRWQLQAIPAQLYSAPRRDNVIVKAEAAPADLSGFGINMSANFKPRSNTINLFYDIGEQIYIRLSGMEFKTPPATYCPNYIDLAAEGYFIP